MGSRLQRRELIPEDEQVTATLNELKLVHGNYGRQIEHKVRVTSGEFKGTEFRGWFSFGKDQESGEEYVPHGAPLYQALAMVEPDLDTVLNDDDLTEKKYEQFIKKSLTKLEGFKVITRVGVKAAKNNPEKKSNILQPGSFGPHKDPDE